MKTRIRIQEFLAAVAIIAGSATACTIIISFVYDIMSAYPELFTGVVPF